MITFTVDNLMAFYLILGMLLLGLALFFHATYRKDSSERRK